MTAGFAGDRCRCGAFKYAGHRCTGQASADRATTEARTWVAEYEHCITAVNAVGLSPRVEYAVGRLLWRERDSWAAKLAELETEAGHDGT